MLTACPVYPLSPMPRQAAIDSGRVYWNKACEPECFEAYVLAKDNLKCEKRSGEWTANKESGYCLLCLNKFGYFDRHHCRACGILCCQHCSSKRLALNHPSPKGSVDRVCDGCFNRLTTEAEARQLAVAKALKIMAAAPPEEDTRPMSPGGSATAGESDKASFSSGQASPSTTVEEEGGRGLHKVMSSGSLSGGFTPVSAAHAHLEQSASMDNLSRQSGAVASASKSFSAANGAVSEVAEALGERGAKLAAVGEKSEALMEGASDFSRMARQLRQKQQRRASAL
jgi:hypothetical protein